MRTPLAIVVGTFLVVGFAAPADAASTKSAHTQESCDKGCANYTGGKRNHVFYACVEKCLQK
ncbi:MAG TPA: hypothetical protein VMI47_06520 [Pseudolabrys sp.]|nr:hypothetical protein [Pseudolabrys sp.]